MRLAASAIVGLLGLLSYAVQAQTLLTITTTNADLAGPVNQTYSRQLMATGGSGSYLWNDDFPNNPRPPGLALNSNGVLSGTPATAGNFQYSVRVIDQKTQQSATKQFTIAITAQQVVITTTSPLPSADANAQYKVTLSASGGTPPYHWLLTGSIDPGLSLDPNAGIIAGTPVAANTYRFSLQAIDSANVASAQTPFTLTVNPGLAIVDTSPLPSGTVGVQFSLALRATGGDSAYTFSTVMSPFDPNQGQLPPGLNLSAGGVLSGTPTLAGSYNFTVRLSDGTGSQITKPFTQTIIGPLTINTPSPLPAAVIGTQYSQKIDVSGGTPPYVFFISNPPPGLTISPTTGVISGTPTQVGTFMFDVAVTDNQKISVTMRYQLTVSAGLVVSPMSLDFFGAVDGDSPPPQELDIAVLIPRTTTYQVLIDGGAVTIAAPVWISVKPASGSPPARVVVRVDQGRMPAGKYPARLRVVDAAGNTTIVPVTLTLSIVAPTLEVVPNEIDVSALVGSPGTFERVVGVRNGGGGGPLNFNAAMLGSSSLVVSVTPNSGQTVRNSLVLVRVRINTQGAAVGSHREELGFTSSGGNPVVPVKVFVADKGSILGTNVSGVRLQARTGGGFSNNPTIRVLNLGDPATTVNWTAAIVTGANLVTLSATRGTATATKPGDLTVSLVPGATLQAAGDYYALIRFTDPQSRNSPVYVIVVLDLASDSTIPLPDPSPVGLVFIAVANGSNPPSQNVVVNTSSTLATTFEVAATTADGNNWLNATPMLGRSSGQTAEQFAASVNINGVVAGVYIGELDISMSGVVRTVMVTLIVLPTGATLPTGAAAAASPSASCTPTKLVITQTGLINNFSVPARWPAFLIAQLNDDCGALVNGGSVTADFSNGDPTLTLKGDGQVGTYSTTWQPGVVSPQMTVTIQAQAGALQPASAQLIGTIDQNVAPVLFKNGTVNVFNRVPAGALAPGMIVEVYGAGLASARATPSILPLPITFNNTFVLVGPNQAPLYFLSDGQLDAQINAELSPNQQYPIVVSANGKLTTPQIIDVAPVQIGVAHYDDGHVIAQHGADFSYVTAASPAKRNEVLVMYLSGMGATNPSVKSGDPAPAVEPLARVTLTPTVMVGGQMAKVEFAGLTPALVGLYQINFDVPGNAPPGDLDLVVIQNGVSSNTTKLPVSN